MSDTQRPRVRVQAGSDAPRSRRWVTGDAETKVRARGMTGDSFANYQANLGYQTVNLSAGGTYGFNPISRLRALLEWAYRGSWLVRQVVDAPADDMTRAGVTIESKLDPVRLTQLEEYWTHWLVWKRLNETIKWARLYGGCLAYVAIDGQDPSTPLRVDTIQKGQFKGLMVLDRWMVYPSLEDVVTTLGLDFGKPKFYTTVVDARSIPSMKIHHSRLIRFDGNELPYFQRLQENEWGISVIETMWDRMLAFDSATTGAAQLVYRAHLRVISIESFRELVAEGGPMYTASLQYIQLLRVMQTNEGVTVMDASDRFEAHQYAFSGLSDMLVQFSQQVSGAAQIPLTRLFGQSPAGLNATGDADLRNYYDFLRAQQQQKLHGPLMLLYDVTHRSRFGEPLPDQFSYSFNPLWQATTGEKYGMANTLTTTVLSAVEAGLVSQRTALKELKQGARETGVWSNVSDEEVNQADPELPQLEEQLAEGGEPPAPDSGDPSPEDQQQNLETAEPDEPQASPAERVAEVFQLGRKTDAARKVVALLGGRGFVRDDLPMIDVHGLTVIVETPRDTRRTGYGWAVQMPAHYGYISGTNSAEGPTEQMDAFVGPEPDSQLAWVVEQLEPDTGTFDEHKVMLCYGSKEDALRDYHAAFADGRGPERVGQVRRMHVDVLRRWLRDSWTPGGKAAKRVG